MKMPNNMKISKEYHSGASNYWLGGEAKDNPFGKLPGSLWEWEDWDEGWHDARAIDNSDIDGENHPAACPKGVL